MDEPIREEHRFAALTKSGDIHESVIFAGSSVHGTADAVLKIGENSIFHGSLHFYRPASFVMGRRSYVGSGTTLHITESIVIGDDVMISSGCVLMDSDFHSYKFSKRRNDVLIEGERCGFTANDKDWSVVPSAPIHLQDKVWIGLSAIILKGVTLGEGCIVGAGSLVSRDVPSWTVVAGNPARAIRALDKETGQ